MDATATTPGRGTPTEPFVSLQDALDAFSFRLGEGSLCLGAGSDGGNLGADAGVGGQPGAVIVGLRLGVGGYDIRGRNLMMVSDVTGAGSDAWVVTNSVMGFVEPGLLSRFGITGEHLFGGLVVRGDARLNQCVLFGNAVTQTGAG